MPAYKRIRKTTKTKIKEVESPVAVTRGEDSQARFFLLLSMFIKATILALVLAFVPLILTGVVLGYSYLKTISTHADVPLNALVNTVRSGWSSPIKQTEGKKNILILGVDTLATRGNESINTDTIMVASLNLESGKVTTISVPRDLFILELRQKVNAVYGTALRQGERAPELVAKAAIEKLIGISLHHVIVLEIEEVGQLIDALGGLEVTVERSFTDEEFPNETIDPRKQQDSRELYKTVSFTAGVERMNGTRALEFIRSRHSKDPIEGSDDARARRQQKVMEALISKLSDTSLIKHPEFIGDLIKLYRENFEASLPLEEMVGVGKIFLSLRRFPMINGQHFGVAGVDKEAVLYHPTRFYTGQWVYLLLDPSGKQMRDTVANWLK